MVLPHSHVYLSEVRVNDIWFLLAVGAIWELFVRLFVLSCKMKPKTLRQKEIDLKLLQVETEYKRSLGMSAFVETSRLERQVLSAEQELTKIYKARKDQVESVEATLLKSGNLQLAAIIWIAYYSIPLLILDAERTLSPAAAAATATGVAASSASCMLRTMLFPISYVGIGIRISRFGLPAEIAAHSLGALVVMWSSQVTVGKIMDVVDALYLQ